MIEDMTIRKLAPNTQRDDVQRIKNFAAFLGRSSDTASFEDMHRYQTASDGERRWRVDHQSNCFDAAVLLPGHAEAA